MGLSRSRIVYKVTHCAVSGAAAARAAAAVASSSDCCCISWVAVCQLQSPLAAAFVLLDVEILLVFCLIAVLCKSYSVLHPMWLLTLLVQQVLT